MVLVDDNFKGIVGENVTREQVVEIAKLLTEPTPVEFSSGKMKIADIGETSLIGFKTIRKLHPSEVVAGWLNAQKEES